jgi:hypothetical protein
MRALSVECSVSSARWRGIGPGTASLNVATRRPAVWCQAPRSGFSGSSRWPAGTNPWPAGSNRWPAAPGRWPGGFGRATAGPISSFSESNRWPPEPNAWPAVPTGTTASPDPTLRSRPRPDVPAASALPIGDSLNGTRSRGRNAPYVTDAGLTRRHSLERSPASTSSSHVPADSVVRGLSETA